MCDLLKVLKKVIQTLPYEVSSDGDRLVISFNIQSTPISISIIEHHYEDRVNLYESEDYYYYSLKFLGIEQNISKEDYSEIISDITKDQEKARKEIKEYYLNIFNNFLNEKVDN